MEKGGATDRSCRLRKRAAENEICADERARPLIRLGVALFLPRGRRSFYRMFPPFATPLSHLLFPFQVTYSHLTNDGNNRRSYKAV